MLDLQPGWIVSKKNYKKASNKLFSQLNLFCNPQTWHMHIVVRTTMSVFAANLNLSTRLHDFKASNQHTDPL